MQDAIREYGIDSLQILPPRKGACPICAATHEPMLPHNRNSYYYQMRFRQEHGHLPTWEDAMEHCTDEMKAEWRNFLKEWGLLPGEVNKDGTGMDSF